MNASVKIDPSATFQRIRGGVEGLASRAKVELPDLIREYRIAIAVAGAVLLALIATLLLWGNEAESNLRPLYGRQELYDAAAIIETLESQGVNYSLHPQSGQVLVAEELVSEARMVLATAGITPRMPAGMELLSADSQLGRSQFVERKQYLEGLQGELEQTIISLRPVRSARVHLAVPERSAFLRDQVKPSASVFLDLYPGVALDSSQVQGILNLVAGSLPDLEQDEVTVLDQNSNPLTGVTGSGDDEASKQLEYIQKLEQQYVQRLSRLIEPLVGAGNLRVAVNADVDFSFREDTVEGYDPESAVVRSESYSGSNSDESAASGVPGAASNVEGEEVVDPESNSSVSQIRNYELDRTVSYRRKDAYSLEQVNVAVVLNSQVPGFRGTRADERLAAIEELLQNAVGIDLDRGDQVSVQALPFYDENSSSRTVLGIAKSENGGSVPMVIGVIVLVLLLLIAVAVYFVRKRKAEQKKLEMERELALLAGGESAEGGGSDNRAPGSFNAADRVRDLAQGNPEQVAMILERWLKEAD